MTITFHLLPLNITIDGKLTIYPNFIRFKDKLSKKLNKGAE